MPVVLYGCEFWSLPLRKAHRMRVFRKRVVRQYVDRRGIRGRRFDKAVQRRASSGVLFDEYNLKITEDKMGRECSTK